jgi:hypothetical protein
VSQSEPAKQDNISRRYVIALIGQGNIGFGLFVTAINITFITLAWLQGPEGERILSVSLVLMAILLSVPLGLLITPQDEKEEKVFSSVGKALVTFLSGWFLAKIDATVATMLKYDNLSTLASFRIVASLTCFVLSISSTYAFRRYADWDELNKYLRRSGPL